MATVEIAESNGAGETVTSGINDTDVGSVDSANLDPVANPIQPGNNSFEKWQRFNVTNMGTSSEVKNLKIWASGSPTGSDSHVTNARETTYGGSETYATPTDANSTVATQAMPTTEPSGANLGIGGSLTGALTATGYSDYLVHQLQVDAGTTTGTTYNVNYQYDVVA